MFDPEVKEVIITRKEYFNSETQEFFYIGPEKPIKIKLKHSLISLSKWEATYKKAFLKATEEKTKDELDTYIKCMALDHDVTDDMIKCLSNEQYNEIFQYVNDTKSATHINENGSKRKRGSKNNDILTSELMYYYISAFRFPISVEKWHLSRLLKLIEVANAKENQANPKNKMDTRAIEKQNNAINKARRAARHSRG